MAPVDTSVSGWLKSDLLHAGLIVALLLGEFAFPSTLSRSLLPNSLVCLSFLTFFFPSFHSLFAPYCFMGRSVLHSCHGNSALFVSLARVLLLHHFFSLCSLPSAGKHWLWCHHSWGLIPFLRPPIPALRSIADVTNPNFKYLYFFLKISQIHRSAIVLFDLMTLWRRRLLKWLWLQ